jgi:cell division protein FtsW (lipid II flippase)
MRWKEKYQTDEKGGYKMKKLLCCLVLFTAFLLIGSVALAEGELPTEPFTWEYLATIAGATVATVLIVQMLKLPLDRIWKIPTRIVVYFISLVILLLATLFTSGLTVQNGILTAVNAVIVALAAMGAYEVTFRKLENK